MECESNRILIELNITECEHRMCMFSLQGQNAHS